MNDRTAMSAYALGAPPARDHGRARTITVATDRAARGDTAGRTVAVIESGPDGVRVHPIVRPTRIAIAVALAAAALWRISRRR